MRKPLAVGDPVRLAHCGWSEDLYTVVEIEDDGLYRIARADGTVAAPSYARNDLARVS